MRSSSSSGADLRPLDPDVSEQRRPWPLRALRTVAWLWLAAGLVGGAIFWLNARETVTITRTITAHARLTFQDIETNVSVFRISMGFLAVLLGLTVWAVLSAVAFLAEDR